MRWLALLLAAWAWTPGAVADGVPVWSVRGEAGTVHILGSVHLLTPGDYPLPAVVEEVYQSADSLLMELDLDDLDVTAVTGLMLELGADGNGPTARQALGEAAWDRAVQRAASAGVDLEPVAGAEPWLVSLMVYNLALARAGYDPALGVDQHLARLAARDGKSIGGLETLGDQLELFDSLAPDVQRQMLEQTLDGLDELAAEAQGLVRAWRDGDLDDLAQQFAQDFAEYPDLERRLVAERNLSWLPAIEARLERPGTTLVVVGALHTVGRDGLPALLAERGYPVRQH